MCYYNDSRTIITSSLHHFITSSPHHFITPSLHHFITSSPHHFITSSLHHFITSSLHVSLRAVQYHSSDDDGNKEFTITRHKHFNSRDHPFLFFCGSQEPSVWSRPQQPLVTPRPSRRCTPLARLRRTTKSVSTCKPTASYKLSPWPNSRTRQHNLRIKHLSPPSQTSRSQGG